MRNLIISAKRYWIILLKLKSFIKNIIVFVLFSGFGIQSVLGLVWLVGNIGNVTVYGNRSMNFLVAAVISLLQLLAIYYGAFRVLESFNIKTKESLLIAVMVVLNPFVLQLALTVSYKGFLLAFILQIVSLIPYESGVKVLRRVACFVVIIAILFGELCFNPGLKTAFVSRMYGGRTSEYNHYLPEDMAERIDPVVFYEADWYPGGVEEVLMPYLEENFDEAFADRLFDIYAVFAKEYHKKDIARLFVVDYVSFLFPAPCTKALIEGRGSGSCVSMSYAEFIKNMPTFSSIYMYYGLWWGLVSLILGAIYIVVSPKRGWNNWVLIFAIVLMFALQNACKGTGMFDYKDAAISIILTNIFLLEPCATEEK